MRVIVATDLSECANEAVRQAAALAGATGALAAVHVVPVLQEISTLFPQVHARDALDESQIIVRMTESVREQVARITSKDAEIFVEEGTHYAEILKRAETWKADVIVIGAHGHSGVASVLGSVAERVVRHALCRVLVARSTTLHGCVLAATDLSDPSLAAVVAAAEEAQRRDVVLEVVHSLDLPREESFHLLGIEIPASYPPKDLRENARRRLASMMHAAGIVGDQRILDGPAAAVVLREAARARAELIVVGAHGNSGFTPLLLGSVAEGIVRAAPCSVLVVRTRSRN
jgi:nucleotide-binding universal stress UspA family protein